MIGVTVEAIKSEGRGSSTGNGWHDTDDVVEAVAAGMARFHEMYDALGHGVVVTYVITVATDASPRRTHGFRPGLPLPVQEHA